MNEKIATHTVTHTAKGPERTGKRQTEESSVWCDLFLQFCSHDLGHEAAHLFSGIVLHLPCGVGVGAEGKPGIVVPQHSGYRFHIYAVLESQYRKSMPIGYNKYVQY